MEPINKRRATYQDVIDSPEHIVAEIIGGELRLSPRPDNPAGAAVAVLLGELWLPFHRGRGAPGSWLLLREPELHFGDEIIVPNLVGWRRERFPLVPDEDFITVLPDWVCEVISPPTEQLDCLEKMPLYAALGVQHAWLVHPRRRTVEAFRIHDGVWAETAVHRDADRARIAPFDAVEIDLARLWADVALSTSA